MMTIEEMRKRKRQLEYTNAQLSDMTDIPLGTLNKILCGATKHPRPENMAVETDAGTAADHGKQEQTIIQLWKLHYIL